MGSYREDEEYRKRCDELHLKALDTDSPYYLDPQTGLRVSTAVALLQRGYCCNLKCRHCPYGNPKVYEKYLMRFK